MQGKLKVWMRAETLLMQLQARALVKKLIGGYIAFVFIFFALILLNVAAFIAIEDAYSSLCAALSLAGVNTLLALVVLYFSFRKSSSKEQGMADELRSLAAQSMKNDLHDVASISRTVGSVLPLIMALLALFSKKKKAPETVDKEN